MQPCQVRSDPASWDVTVAREQATEHFPAEMLHGSRGAVSAEDGSDQWALLRKSRGRYVCLTPSAFGT